MQLLGSSLPPFDLTIRSRTSSGRVAWMTIVAKRSRGIFIVSVAVSTVSRDIFKVVISGYTSALIPLTPWKTFIREIISLKVRRGAKSEEWRARPSNCRSDGGQGEVRFLRHVPAR